MRRDGMSSNEAENQIQDAREQLEEYIINDEQEYAEDICQEFFGLEPDYIHELL